MLGKISDIYASYTTKDKIELLLIEVTSNDTWEVSNQKLYELADATTSIEDGNKIVEHLLSKVSSPGHEWRRIIKALNALDFLIKNGSLHVQGKVQMQGQANLRSLQNFEHKEEGIERGSSIRAKAL